MKPAALIPLAAMVLAGCQDRPHITEPEALVPPPQFTASPGNLDGATNPVTINFQAVISSVFARTAGRQPLDPNVIIGSVVSVGDILTGSFVYDLSVNTDVLPDNPIFGFYPNAPLSASFSVGGLNVNIDPAVSGSLEFRNNALFAGNPPSDQFIMSAVNNDGLDPQTPIPGTIFGGTQIIQLVFATLDATVLTSDAMQVMPSAEWEQARRFFFRESDGDIFLFIEANIVAFEVLTALQLLIDIKPGSDPNSINCNNENESITVAILSTDDFDATTVDHTTVTFEGASEIHVDKKTGVARRHEEDVDGDLDTDLVLHFRLGETGLTCDSEEGTLTGETFGGQAIEGTDAVRTVGA